METFGILRQPLLREKMPLIVDTQFRGSARKPLGPISTSADGVLATGSAYARPSARPPLQAVTFKHLPQPLRSHIRSFGTLGELLKIARPSGHYVCLASSKKWSLYLPAISINDQECACT
jgi:hypothetical protein